MCSLSEPPGGGSENPAAEMIRAKREFGGGHGSFGVCEEDSVVRWLAWERTGRVTSTSISFNRTLGLYLYFSVVAFFSFEYKKTYS